MFGSKCLLPLILLFVYPCWDSSFASNRLFEHVCSSQPIISGDRGIATLAETPAYFINTIDDPKYKVRYSIMPDRNVRRGSIPSIRAAILRATDKENEIVGNWETFQGPFEEVFCPQNGSAVRDSSVAVLNDDTYLLPVFEAAWIAPTEYSGSVFISGYVYDSRKRIHRLAPVHAMHTDGWNVNQYPSLEECGTTKGCYLIPPNCALHNCLYALTWQTNGDQVKFEIMGKADGWVGVGFSRDKVSFDDFTVCMRNNEDGVEQRIVHFTGNHNQNPEVYEIENELADNNRRHRGLYRNQRIFCTFTKTKRSNLGQMHEYNWLANLENPNYIIATFGDRGDIIGDVPFIYKPSNRPIASHSRVNFNKEAYPARGYPTSSWLIKIYMILMLIAWVLLASVAILTSRYYRPIWNDTRSQQRDKRSWLTIHQPLIITIAVLTVIAFIFILFAANWSWPHHGTLFWHGVLGVIVLVCSIINAILVLCVPRHYTRAYCVWFWTHWLISSIAHCLAIPLIFLGMDLPRLDLWDWCSWLLLCWCIFHIITNLILEIHYCMTYRRSYERFEEADVKRRKPDRIYPPGHQWKPFCLGLYIVFTSAVVLTLIIATMVFD